MTVASSTRRVLYLGDGVTTVFPVPFRFLANEDLAVVRAVADVEAALTLNVDYTVTGANLPTGGSLTMTTAPVAGARLLIKRTTTREQPIDFTPFDPFPAETQERGLDRGILISQEDGDDTSRALRLPETDATGAQMVLPVASARAGKFLGFDGAASPVALSGTGADSALRADLAAAAAPGGGQLVTLTSPIVGAIARTTADRAQDVVSVFDFMPAAVIASIRAGTLVDITDYLNLATGAAQVHSGNDTELKRIITVPGGTYALGGGNKSVFLRKGQTLDCGSMGAVFFDLSATTSNTNPIIRGGESASLVIDPGGLAVEVAGGFWFGGPATAAVIHMQTPSGYFVRDAFLTSAGIGVLMGGGDGKLSRCIIDQGLIGVNLGGQNNVISDCLFYQINYQIQCDSAVDCEINGCHFEYPIYASIQIGTGSGEQINALTIRGNSFTMNAQYATFTGFVSMSCTNSKIDIIGGNTFKNGFGYAINTLTGLGNKVLVDGAVFDGTRSTPLYVQGTTMGGVNATNIDVTIRNCTFRNLPGQPILHGGTFDAQTFVHSCRFDNNTGGVTEILINGTNGGGTAKAVYVGNVSSRTLFNIQGVVPVSSEANY